MTWAQKHNIKHILIEPGSPTQNAYIESFNGALRDECLDEHWFESLEQTRQSIATWRTDYNEIRPHSSCGGRSAGLQKARGETWGGWLNSYVRITCDSKANKRQLKQKIRAKKDQHQ